jgi:hypothetical protein
VRPRIEGAELNYDELPGLEGLYLEDSFVREIVETDDSTRFTLVAALTPEHPAHDDPVTPEAHCYRLATLTFPNLRARTWHARTTDRFVDADEGVDLGNIDRFTAGEDGVYRLEGEWGSVELRSDAPELALLHRESFEHKDRRKAYAAWIEGGGSRVEGRRTIE